MNFSKSLRYILIILIIFSSKDLICQNELSQEVSHINNVDLIELPLLDNALLKKVNQKNSPNTFAEGRDVNVSPNLNGTWESTKSGDVVWRQRIKSPNAYSLNLGFTEFKLKEGVRLFLYNRSKTEIIGPFTYKDNDDHLQLWTPMVSGDEIIIEVQGSLEAISKSKMLISSVNHDFTDVKAKLLSGNCNIDVVCGEADGLGIVDNYRDIISSVGAYTLNGRNQCSGMLINNTAMDCKPYFITADHCNINDSNASSVVVYWNYENQTCRQPFSIESGQIGNGPRNQFNTGSVLIANSVNSDFALIELDDQIDPRLNLFFAGWDLSGELTDTSICIHHPNVEEKRISFDFDPMVYETGNVETDFVRVLDWDLGTTEPGSSGSPIFNSRKQFVGQLTGGFAACGNDEYDAFGYINYSWDRNSSNDRSLKSWLDPLSTGQQSMEGTFCGLNLNLSANQIDICATENDEVVVDILPSVFFEMDLEYDVLEVPEGLIVEFEKESSSGTEGNSLTISGFGNIEDGEYIVQIVANDGVNNIEATIVLNIVSNIPAIPELKEPINNTEGIFSKVTLKLKRAEEAKNEFHLAIDSEFENIIIETTTDFNSATVSNLENDTEYYWRSRSLNICGNSEWSEVYRFKTAPSFCTHITSFDGPFVIDEAIENEVSSMILINYPVNVQDVNVQNINGTHTYLEDLNFKLSFNGDEILLAGEICGNMDDFNFGFDDESSNTQIECPPIEGDLFVPSQALETYDGKLAGGEWTLNIEDMVTNDGGIFKDWTVKVCFNETEAPVIVPEYHKYSYCENQLLSINAFYDTKDILDFDIMVFDLNGQNVLESYSINSNKLNQLALNVRTELLSGIESQVQIVLQNKSNSEILAFSILDLVKSGGEQTLNITSPLNEEIFPFDGFTNVTWDDDFEGMTKVDVSVDALFQDIVYSETVVNLNSIDVSNLSLLPGVYFARIKNTYECGEVPSDIIEFIIDESNSIEYTPNLPVTIYPNPTDGLIYIKNDNKFEEQTEIQLFDIAGRNYSPKLHFISQNLVILDLRTKEDGLYIVKIRKGQNVIQKMIFKSH